ncbi:MAG: hypothetical protein KBT34_10040 [Prevotella sp.]|nr:hypothetical protein [Candidatus Prevotella equi]
MIKIENVVLPSAAQWDAVIRGMRNPMNSWEKSDSYITYVEDCDTAETADYEFFVGENDLKLMNSLADAGSAHAKYKRMLCVLCDIVAPMYWWKEWDTYLHTVRNSCSTMHKIQAKKFDLNDFSTEHLEWREENMTWGQRIPLRNMENTIVCLNQCREKYLETKEKMWWWQMIQLLPSSYNQRSTVMMNYETLTAIYRWRRNHKLDEWQAFCDWIETLPYSELITGKGVRNEDKH